ARGPSPSQDASRSRSTAATRTTMPQPRVRRVTGTGTYVTTTPDRAPMIVPPTRPSRVIWIVIQEPAIRSGQAAQMADHSKVMAFLHEVRHPHGGRDRKSTRLNSSHVK